MNYNKNIITASVLAILSFTACSGGSSSSTSDPVQTPQNIAIDVVCEDTPDASAMQNYITTLSGDTIIKDTNDTTISLFIDSDNVKKVCLVNGSAHIQR